MKSKNHLVMGNMPRQYGDLVCICVPRSGFETLWIGITFDDDSCVGPNELAISEKNDKPFTKPARYDMLRSLTRLATARDQKEHEHRRRIWSHGPAAKGTGPSAFILELG